MSAALELNAKSDIVASAYAACVLPYCGRSYEMRFFTGNKSLLGPEIKLLSCKSAQWHVFITEPNIFPPDGVKRVYLFVFVCVCCSLG